MKFKYIFILLFIILGGKCFGQDKINYIFFYKPYTHKEETNFYNVDTILVFNYSTQYENIKKADVDADIERAIFYHDFRLVSILANGYLYPGLEDSNRNKEGAINPKDLTDENNYYIKKYGYKVISGTSPTLFYNAPPLQKVAYAYAKKYNLKMLEILKRKVK